MESVPEEPKDVKGKRDVILALFLDNFGATINEITSEMVKFLFHAYDLVFFKGQILTRLKNIDADPKFAFEANRRNSGYGSLSGFYYEKTLKSDKKTYRYKKKYFIDISPDILKGGDAGELHIPKAAGLGCNSVIECFMLIMEHEIIHLLFSLWEFDAPKLQKENYKVYGPHGQLFECMLNTYFGHVEYSHNLSLKGIGGDTSYISKPKYGLKLGFSYWENSCYMDSVLTLLLENQCRYWRSTIFGFKGGESENPDLAEMLKLELYKDYKNLKEGSTVECKRFRKLMAIHDPLIKEEGSWVRYETAAFYASLAELFPKLKIDVPIRMIRPKLDHNTENLRYKSVYLFTVEEYINPDFSKTEDYKEIMWKELKSPIIVFSNQGTRRIKYFDRLDDDKKQILKPRILGKYKLVGVVTLKGKISEKGGGEHYISYFVAKDGNWYSYDDLSPKIKMVGDGYVDDLPRDGIWQEKNNKMPSLYFYALDEYGIDRRRTNDLAFEKVKRPDGGYVFEIVFDEPETGEKIAKFADELNGVITLGDRKIFLRLGNSTDANIMEDFLLNV